MKLKHIFAKCIDLLHTPLRQKSTNDPFHTTFQKFVALTSGDHSASILEIGSRNVSGVQRKEIFSHCNEHIGFDIKKGDGVDVIGDVHSLAEHFPESHFDYVFSVSVFEHVLMPWKAVLEINKVMKKGGVLFLSTHPVWPSHEQPWDFWRFPANGFHALFNKHTGFEIQTLSEGLPAKMYSLVEDAPTRNNSLHTINQGVALIAKKTSDFRSDLVKWDIELNEIVDSIYPDA